MSPIITNGMSFPRISAAGHRAGFLLLDDRQGGEDHRHEHQEQPQHPRDHEVRAAQLGVVPDPRLHLDRGGDAGELATRAGDRLRRIARADRGRARIAAVDQQLHRGRPRGDDVPAVAARDHQDQPCAAGLKHPLGAAEGRDRTGRLEKPRRGEARGELAALGRPVEVADHRRDVAHVEVRGVAQKDELDHGGDKEDREEPGVPADLLQLLDDHPPEAAHRVLLRMRADARASAAAENSTSPSAWSHHTATLAPLSRMSRMAAR
jgi:hypothetical protein